MANILKVHAVHQYDFIVCIYSPPCLRRSMLSLCRQAATVNSAIPQCSLSNSAYSQVVFPLQPKMLADFFAILIPSQTPRQTSYRDSMTPSAVATPCHLWQEDRIAVSQQHCDTNPHEATDLSLVKRLPSSSLSNIPKQC